MFLFTGARVPQSSVRLLFKEFELVTEDEEIKKESSRSTEEDRLAEYQQLMRSQQVKGLEGKFSEEELETTAVHETEDDQQFLKFKKRTEAEPDQVQLFHSNRWTFPFTLILWLVYNCNENISTTVSNQ